MLALFSSGTSLRSSDLVESTTSAHSIHIPLVRACPSLTHCGVSRHFRVLVHAARLLCRHHSQFRCPSVWTSSLSSSWLPSPRVSVVRACVIAVCVPCEDCVLPCKTSRTPFERLYSYTREGMSQCVLRGVFTDKVGQRGGSGGVLGLRTLG